LSSFFRPLPFKPALVLHGPPAQRVQDGRDFPHFAHRNPLGNPPGFVFLPRGWPVFFLFSWPAPCCCIPPMSPHCFTHGLPTFPPSSISGAPHPLFPTAAFSISCVSLNSPHSSPKKRYSFCRDPPSLSVISFFFFFCFFFVLVFY